MTIVDVAVHKWRMLDEKRRRVLLSFLGLLIGLLIVIVYVSILKGRPNEQTNVQTEANNHHLEAKPINLINTTSINNNTNEENKQISVIS